ncbi:P-loop containing nucleoside triphosphate hydrolase protein [Myxozyma melibiosi]|uniref:Cell division control protein n=1 Tax=Myxozyma melibiosi TaxID=54550 RepID=A0ABR1F730_9ASCO
MVRLLPWAKSDAQPNASVLGKRARSELNMSSPQRAYKTRAQLASTKVSSSSGDSSASSDMKEADIAVRKIPVSKEKKENIPCIPGSVTPPRTPRKLKRTAAEMSCSPQSPDRSKPELLRQQQQIALPTPPLTPSTPSTPSLYSTAKSVFQRGARSTAPLICRDTEREAITSFLTTHIDNATAASLYISGPPGTGKSALTAEVIHSTCDGDKSVKVANINCVTITKPALVFAKIYEEITGSSIAEGEYGRAADRLEEYFTRRKASRGQYRSIIITLDEMDYLITKDQDVLYQIFEWTRLPKSNLILIGIANALNLTSRFLPKLKARNFSPELLRFTPYTADQIAQVIKSRMENYLATVEDQSVRSMSEGLIHPAAIQLCARKTAANTGDLRKAFDICRRGLDLAEDEARRKYCGAEAQTAEGYFSSTPTRKSVAPIIIPTGSPAPKVTIAHIAKICSTAFGGSSVQRIQSLNLQQKAILCALVVGEKRKSTSLTVRELFEKYGALCAKDKLLDSLKISEFREVVSALEACGAVSLSSTGSGQKGGGKRARGSSDSSDGQRISASVQEIDLLRAVEDVGMLKRFFSAEYDV